MPSAVRIYTLNFALSGPDRSGAGALRSALNARSDVYCHENVLHTSEDADGETLRREAYEDYFGPSRSPVYPEWFLPKEISPGRYLDHTIFDEPRRGEKAIGIRLSHAEFSRYELWDYLSEKCCEGDFCFIYMRRNPVASLVSLKQAKQYRLWRISAAETLNEQPPPAITLDASEVVEYIRLCDVAEKRFRNACADCLVIEYMEFAQRTDRVLTRVASFLELDEKTIPGPTTLRLRNLPMRDRIRNFDELRKKAPAIVRAHLEAEDLY